MMNFLAYFKYSYSPTAETKQTKDMIAFLCVADTFGSLQTVINFGTGELH